MANNAPFRVLFVCMGNICRSPAAESVFRHHLQQNALDDLVTCDSAGTIDMHTGNAPDSRMQAAGEKRGVTVAGSARPVVPADLGKFDLVLAMDEDNLFDLERMAEDHGDRATATVRLFCEYADDDAVEVPDPYYGGDEGFERVMDLLEDGCRNLILELESELREPA